MRSYLLYYLCRIQLEMVLAFERWYSFDAADFLQVSFFVLVPCSAPHWSSSVSPDIHSTSVGCRVTWEDGIGEPIENHGISFYCIIVTGQPVTLSSHKTKSLIYGG